MYMNPQASVSDLAEYYSDNYYSFDFEPRSGLRAKLKEAVFRHWRGEKEKSLPIALGAMPYRSLVRHYPPARPRGRLLDLGCGSGEALLELRKAGWDVVGLDSSKVAAEKGRQHGLDVRVGEAEELDFPPGSFDWIRMSHLLEHVVDPRGLLERARGVLRPRGRVLIALSDCGGLPSRILGRHWPNWRIPEHLWFFTASSVSRLLRVSGFRVLSIRRYFNPSRFLWGFSSRYGWNLRPRFGFPLIGGRLDPGGLSDELVVVAKSSGDDQ
jgi:SAM-dependent methyltransferase